MLTALVLAAQLSAGHHWPPGAHVAVWVDPNHAPPDAAMLIHRAMKTWSDASNGQLTLVPAAKREDAAIRIVFVASDSVYGEAAPRLDAATGFIAYADVAINGVGSSVNPAVNADATDARVVLYLTALHELGHAIGLAHSDSFSAIMYRFRRADDGARYFGAYRKKLRSADDVGSPTATGLGEEDIVALRSLYR